MLKPVGLPLMFVILCAVGRAATAEPPRNAVEAARTAPAERPRHAIYVELLGKGGLWGVGYDYQVKPWLAVGAAASYYQITGDRYMTLSPYAAIYPVGHGNKRWFVQVGPQMVRHKTPSPVPEWMGMTTNGFAGELSSGFEYRNHVLVRAYAMVSIGEHVVPWMGVSIGWSL